MAPHGAKVVEELNTTGEASQGEGAGYVRIVM